MKRGRTPRKGSKDVLPKRSVLSDLVRDPARTINDYAKTTPVTLAPGSTPSIVENKPRRRG